MPGRCGWCGKEGPPFFDCEEYETHLEDEKLARSVSYVISRLSYLNREPSDTLTARALDTLGMAKLQQVRITQRSPRDFGYFSARSLDYQLKRFLKLVSKLENAMYRIPRLFPLLPERRRQS